MIDTLRQATYHFVDDVLRTVRTFRELMTSKNYQNAFIGKKCSTITRVRWTRIRKISTIFAKRQMDLLKNVLVQKVSLETNIEFCMFLFANCKMNPRRRNLWLIGCVNIDFIFTDDPDKTFSNQFSAKMKFWFADPSEIWSTWMTIVVRLG